MIGNHGQNDQDVEEETRRMRRRSIAILLRSTCTGRTSSSSSSISWTVIIQCSFLELRSFSIIIMYRIACVHHNSVFELYRPLDI